ncbi:unnamed protein product [Somion occarium]|uniref:Rrp15p-domain-containing protein n=1 Tax=Somion occarium TaxID=3059160 RepID=A0ABP1CKW1_9APHY
MIASLPPTKMPPAKRQKLSPPNESDVSEHEVIDASVASDAEGSASIASGSGNSSPDTEDEIEASKFTKSKKTLKRKHRATDATRFGSTLQFLLNTDAPSTLPLSLKPSVNRKRIDEKLELKGKKILQVEKKEKEEKSRIRDVIGGWGGEGERALRKVAQRGVVKLFNVIQQSQAQTNAAEEGLKAQRGTGKPTLPAPEIDGKLKKKGKQKGALGGAREAALGQNDFLNSIKSGGIVSKV